MESGACSEVAQRFCRVSYDSSYFLLPPPLPLHLLHALLLLFLLLPLPPFLTKELQKLLLNLLSRGRERRRRGSAGGRRTLARDESGCERVQRGEHVPYSFSHLVAPASHYGHHLPARNPERGTHPVKWE